MSTDARPSGRGWLARVPVIRWRTRLNVRVALVADGRRYRLTARNVSPLRDVYVTHAWFGDNPRYDILSQAPFPGTGRPRIELNTRVAPGETWSAEVEVGDLAGIDDIEHAGRVRTSLGKVVASRPGRREGGGR